MKKEGLYSLKEVNMDGMDILHVEITMLVEVEIFSPCLLIQTIKDVYWGPYFLNLLSFNIKTHSVENS